MEVFNHKMVCNDQGMISNSTIMYFLLIFVGRVKLNIMPCWPKLVSITIMATTLIQEQLVENISECAHSVSLILVSFPIYNCIFFSLLFGSFIYFQLNVKIQLILTHINQHAHKFYANQCFHNEIYLSNVMSLDLSLLKIFNLFWYSCFMLSATFLFKNL